jgi:uncharacterized protein
MISIELLKLIKSEFKLDWYGIHGINHWARVRENGIKLAKLNGANIKVVELFAFLHDSQRKHDGSDAGHGRRAAEFTTSIRSQYMDLTDAELELLTFACINHSNGFTEADITVQTCWDADRLDLGRVGIKPEPQYLCTAAAKDKEIINWAYQRSRIYHPVFINRITGKATAKTKSNSSWLDKIYQKIFQ